MISGKLEHWLAGKSQDKYTKDNFQAFRPIIDIDGRLEMNQWETGSDYQCDYSLVIRPNAQEEGKPALVFPSSRTLSPLPSQKILFEEKEGDS